MPYAPVKSDPYKKGGAQSCKGPLWPERVWRDIVDALGDIELRIRIIRLANQNLPKRYRRNA